MAKKSKSKSKLKLPKEVAGVKVPKGLRKQAKRLLEIIDTPAGRELAATGLTLAAASLVNKASDGRASDRTKAVARDTENAAGKNRSGEMADLGAILSAAVTEGARRFVQGFEEGKQANASNEASRRPPRRPSRPQPVGESGAEPADRGE